MYHQFPQLAERVYPCGPHWQARMLFPVASSRPSSCKEWSKEQMSQAYSAVVNDGLSIRCSALEYDVPKSTLGDTVERFCLEQRVREQGT